MLLYFLIVDSFLLWVQAALIRTLLWKRNERIQATHDRQKTENDLEPLVTRSNEDEEPTTNATNPGPEILDTREMQQESNSAVIAEETRVVGSLPEEERRELHRGGSRGGAPGARAPP